MGDDREQITDVLIRYATGIDTKDWPLFRTCFTDDLHADYGETGVWDGLDAITEFMASIHRDMPVTNHMMSNIAIDVDGDTATARSYVHAVLVVDAGRAHSVDAVGSYDDALLRTSDGWRIRERTFSSTRTVIS